MSIEDAKNNTLKQVEADEESEDESSEQEVKELKHDYNEMFPGVF